MPRIRTIKPEFWSDEKLAPLSPTDRLVFLGLIGMADDLGRVQDNQRVIDSFIFPLTDDTTATSLATLERLERIERGVTSSGQRVIQIRNWTTHQKIDRPNYYGSLPPIAGAKLVPKRKRAAGLSPAIPTISPAEEAFDEGSSNHTNDQRPTTNDQRPENSDSTDWFESAQAVWLAAYGTSLNADKGRKHLQRVVESVGEVEFLTRWKAYTEATDLRFASPSSFSEKHTAFRPDLQGRRAVDRRTPHLAANDLPVETECF
jgi:hypothetical protein